VLDDLSGVPRYLQIARVLEREIRDGKYQPGQPVASRHQVAQRWGVAVETAARAHRWLVERGYLASVPGVGMVVTPVSMWPSEGSS
jgi:DNA-binding GntR family transcriptional regulator